MLVLRAVKKVGQHSTLLASNRISIRNVNMLATVPEFVKSYMKDKGTEVPFAKQVFTDKEYKTYEIYRNVKIGKYDFLNNYIKTQNPTNEEIKSITDYVLDLKKQPYNIPNFVLGYFTGSLTFTGYTGAMSYMFAGHKTLMEFIRHPIAPYILPMIGYFILTNIGWKLFKYSASVIVTEFKSPYYQYDKMLKTLKTLTEADTKIWFENRQKNKQKSQNTSNKSHISDAEKVCHN